MNFFEIVAARYSHRTKFTSAKVPKEDLSKIITAATQAPSGCNAQTTYFTVVTDPALLAQLVEIFPAEATETASAIIVVATEKVTFDFGVPMEFEIEDYAAAVQNILLATTSLGYASCWYDGGTRLNDNDKKIAKLLDIPETRQVRTILPIGVPETVGTQAGRKPIEERVVWK